MHACTSGKCRPSDPQGQLELSVVQLGGGCDGHQYEADAPKPKIWWRHQYVSGDEEADTTLDADFDTGMPQARRPAPAPSPVVWGAHAADAEAKGFVKPWSAAYVP